MSYQVGHQYQDPYSKTLYSYAGNDLWLSQGGRQQSAVNSFQLGIPSTPPVTTTPAVQPITTAPPATTTVPQITMPPPAPNPVVTPPPSPVPVPAVTTPAVQPAVQKTVSLGGFRSGKKTQDSANQYIQSLATQLGVPAEQVSKHYTQWYADSSLGNSASALDRFIRSQVQAEGPAWTVGQTRGQGAEVWNGSQWVTAPPPQTTPAIPPATPYQEPLIAPQRDDNPLSNALALARAVSAEYGPRQIGGADLQREAAALGLGQYQNTQALQEEALRLANQDADSAYQKADEQLRNRYGGIGIGGMQKQRAYDLAQDYALQKAKMGHGLRREFDDLGFNRNLALLDRSSQLLSRDQAIQEDRFAQVLGAGLRQNELQTGLVQRERDRANGLQETEARLNHDAGMRQWELNQQSKAAMQSELFGMLAPLLMPQQGGLGLSSGLAQLGGLPGGAGGGQSLLNPLANIFGMVPGLENLDLGSLLALMAVQQ